MPNFQFNSLELKGREAEAEYISKVRRQYSELFGKEYYSAFSEDDEKRAREAVEKMQPWPDPSDPSPEFANDLHATLADKLGLEDYADLEFYTAVNSHLDLYFGQDAFFKIKIGDKEIIVSLDLTANPDKVSSKADVIIHVPSDYVVSRKENRSEYLAIISETVDTIIRKMKNKLS